METVITTPVWQLLLACFGSLFFVVYTIRAWRRSDRSGIVYGGILSLLITGIVPIVACERVVVSPESLRLEGLLESSAYTLIGVERALWEVRYDSSGDLDRTLCLYSRAQHEAEVDIELDEGSIDEGSIDEGSNVERVRRTTLLEGEWQQVDRALRALGIATEESY